MERDGTAAVVNETRQVPSVQRSVEEEVKQRKRSEARAVRYGSEERRRHRAASNIGERRKKKKEVLEGSDKKRRLLECIEESASCLAYRGAPCQTGAFRGSHSRIDRHILPVK